MTNPPPRADDESPAAHAKQSVVSVAATAATATAPDFQLRELMAVREIAHAFLTADRPEEVFRFALERVSPLVGAAFASVFLVDGASELMGLAAAHNWPERYRPWLGEMKVRVGYGPSGEAVAERRAVEVPDVFADSSLADWQDVATELGFRAIVALPLQTGRRVLGAVTFYFAGAGGFSPEQRSLLRIVADQMAATAEKASLIDDLRRTNAALVESKAELEQQYVAVLEARRVKDEFLANVSHELRTPLTAVMGYISLLQEGISGPLTPEQGRDLDQVRGASDRLLALIDNLLEMTTLKRGNLVLELEEFDPRRPLRDAVATTKGRPASVELRVEMPEHFLPPMRSDRKKITKILVSLLSNAYKFTPKGEVRLAVAVERGRVTYAVQDTGIGIPAGAVHAVFDEFRQGDGSMTRRYGGTGLGLALSRRLAQLLGGDIEVASTPGQGTTFTVELPLETVPSSPMASPIAPTDGADSL
ncbi:MAG TPA: GAF domain-containing sensor histidine kinase [Gemmatimonadaceae bacterium]|nr:GAF domain-containing sensor histidine kinase [Gemmatimonadaceae bacterium]